MTTMPSAKAGPARASTRSRVSDDTAVTPAGGRSDVETVEITPSVGFAWMVQGIRPYLGFVCVGLGLLALFLGWWGASGTPIVAKQIPYLASDGVLAVVLIAIGNRIFLIDDLRRDSGRLDRLEQMVQELHAVLLARGDAIPEQAASPSANSAKPYLALAKGTSYHLPDCAMVSGKDAERLSKSDVASRSLRPCRMCEPPAVKK
jgi:hypothetical protein